MSWLSVCHFEIVRGCQLRCVGCVNSVTQPKVEPIALETFRACLANMDRLRMIQLLRLFNYGEPLLHPRLPEVLEAVRARPWKIGVLELSTNGQALNRDRLRDAFATGMVGQLVVSADGDGSPGDYERLRPPGKWERLQEFLEAAAALRGRHSPGTALTARICVRSRADMARWREALPRGWAPEFRGWMNLPGAPNVTGKPLRRGQGACYFLEGRQLYVDADGTVVPCCAHPRAAVLGSLVDQKLSDMMRARRRFRIRLEEDRRSVSACHGCEFGPSSERGQSFEGLTAPARFPA